MFTLIQGLSMTRRDMQCCLDETCAECPTVMADREEHPTLNDNHNTGSESFYEPLSSDLKQQSPDHDSSNVNQSSTSVVPDNDRPQASRPDTRNRLESKILFGNRYFEAGNASRLATTEPKTAAQSRPAIIQWEPSKGYQHSDVHNHIKGTSVSVHSTPVMSGWIKQAERDRDSRIHHMEQFKNDDDITFETKYHCKEVLQDKAVDLTSARHCQDTFTAARIGQTDLQALDLSTSSRTPSPTNSYYSRAGTPVSPTASSMPLTPNTNVSIATDEVVTSVQHQSQSGYVDLNIYTHNINVIVKSQDHEPKWEDNIQNSNSNGVKAAAVNVQCTESGKPYECQIGNVTFKHRHHHSVRHRRSHTVKKQFQCQECGTRFARKCILTNHMRVHSAKKAYCCGKCGAAFSRLHQLGRHMKTHKLKQGLDGTESTIDQYECSKCPAKFAHANSLSRHVKTHNNQSFDSKLNTSNSMAADYTSETATTLTQTSHQLSQSANTFDSTNHETKRDQNQNWTSKRLDFY